MTKTIRIAAGQGFWGDWLEAPVRQVQGGPIDYLMMDYLAEVTMSILQKQRSRDPNFGYARDFVPLIARILPELVSRRFRVISNAGGVNPRACAEAIIGGARIQGFGGQLKVALVTGDDILPRLDELLAAGHEMRDMDTGRPLSDIRDQVVSANAYIGMAPVVEALGRGADIVVTGRVTDTGLTLGPLVHEHGWDPNDWDLIAAGTIAGHIIECGAQASGGNLLKDWHKVKGLADPGFPIVEVAVHVVRCGRPLPFGLHGGPVVIVHGVFPDFARRDPACRRRITQQAEVAVGPCVLAGDQVQVPRCRIACFDGQLHAGFRGHQGRVMARDCRQPAPEHGAEQDDQQQHQ